MYLFIFDKTKDEIKKLIKKANIKKFIIASDILIADKTLEQIYEDDLNGW